MGNALSSWFHKESPSPVVLVPPLFERPYIATRSRYLLPIALVQNRSLLLMLMMIMAIHVLLLLFCFQF
jgi:hypothetical protein